MGSDNKVSELDLTLSAVASQLFGVDEKVVIEAILDSPNARGYIIGSISELLLRNTLIGQGFKVLRIKEKWEGLKSNSEKWARSAEVNFFKKLSGKKQNSPDKIWFDALPQHEKSILRDEKDQPGIRLCQTHMPSGKKTNESREDGRTQASPRFDEFHLLAVDMYTKTGKHDFVFAVSDELTRSKKDHNHLLQNYFITLVMPSTLLPLEPLAVPWSTDLKSLFSKLKNPININDMQIDQRKPGERAEGVISF